MATTWRIEPAGPLHGDVMVRGSKNAVTKHMVAALLADGPCIIQQLDSTTAVPPGARARVDEWHNIQITLV